MIFATEEINKNPYLLPNMSLIFSVLADMCFDSLKVIDEIHSTQNNVSKLPNYDCRKSTCDVSLTGPSWSTSIKMTTFIKHPKVRQSGKK